MAVPISDLNIDDFFKDSARILSILYAQFPRKTTVYLEDVCGPDEPDEFGLHSERHLAALGALVWLKEEHHIRYDSLVRQEAADEVVLTGRTFTLLTMPASFREPHDVTGLPESVRLEHGSNIHRLREALRSRSSLRIRKAMTDLLAAAVQMKEA